MMMAGSEDQQYIQNILPFRGEGREGQVAKRHTLNTTGFKPKAFDTKSTDHRDILQNSRLEWTGHVT
jgi:hypothetical protein